MIDGWIAVALRVGGVALMLVVLVDAFLTVLYARVGISVFSNQIGRLTWRVWRWVALKLPRRYRGGVLSFCGPLLVVLLIVLWAGALAVGAAMVFQPAMGTSIRRGGGEVTPTDFISALFVAANSMSVVGSGSFEPETSLFRLIFMANSLIGVCMISLTLTYLLHVYNALERRSAASLNAHISTGNTGDAAEYVIGLGPAGDFANAPMRLQAVATEVAGVKESHHFYSLLLYFRLPEPEYSPSRMVLVMLDAVSLMWSALDQDRYRTLVKNGATSDLWRATLRMLTGLDDALLKHGEPGPRDTLDDATRAAWRRRYTAAIRAFQRAQIATQPDEQAGFERYVELRRQWQSRLDAYRKFGGFEPDDVDPIGAACAADAPADARRSIDLTAAA